MEGEYKINQTITADQLLFVSKYVIRRAPTDYQVETMTLCWRMTNLFVTASARKIVLLVCTFRWTWLRFVVIYQNIAVDESIQKSGMLNGWSIGQKKLKAYVLFDFIGRAPQAVGDYPNNCFYSGTISCVVLTTSYD